MKTRKNVKKTTLSVLQHFLVLLQFHLQHLQQTVTLPLKKMHGQKGHRNGIFLRYIYKESQSLMSGMQSDMILKFEDSGRSLLGFVAPFDVSWLDNVTLSNDISFTEGKEGILMKVLLNDNKICTLEYYLDPDSQDIYMRIPELSDKYFKTNLEEAADQQAANIENDLEELTPDDSDADIPTDNFASAYSDSLSLTVSMMSDLSATAPEASVVETTSG